MPSTVTFTGPIGIGVSVTSLVFTNVTSVQFEIERNVVRITQSSPNKITYIDYDATTTVTYTISGADATVTISQ